MFKEITENEYLEQIRKDNSSYVLVFHALWCPPCRMFKSSLEELAAKDNINVYRVNVDENTNLSAQFGVQSLPTWFIFKDGKIAKKNMGYLPYEQLKQEVKKLI